MGVKIILSNRLQESSVSRIQYHVNNGNPMAFVSAYRNEYSNTENINRDRQLKRWARMVEIPEAHGDKVNTAYSYIKTLGGYAEGGNKGVSEMSIALIADKDKEQELLNFATAVGEYFNQDSILFIPSEGDAYYLSTNDNEDNWVGPKGSKLMLSRKVNLNNKLIDKIGGFTQPDRNKRTLKDGQIFVIGEDFTFNNDFTVNKNSISNKVCSNMLKNYLLEYGPDCINKFIERQVKG